MEGTFGLFLDFQLEPLKDQESTSMLRYVALKKSWKEKMMKVLPASEPSWFPGFLSGTFTRNVFGYGQKPTSATPTPRLFFIFHPNLNFDDQRI